VVANSQWCVTLFFFLVPFCCPFPRLPSRLAMIRLSIPACSAFSKPRSRLARRTYGVWTRAQRETRPASQKARGSRLVGVSVGVGLNVCARACLDLHLWVRPSLRAHVYRVCAVVLWRNGVEKRVRMRLRGGERETETETRTRRRTRTKGRAQTRRKDTDEGGRQSKRQRGRERERERERERGRKKPRAE
jgi:hypothetical protein